ncbi:MAG: hypothetical protein WEA31_07395 [Pirellulales bacterium]
MTETALFSLGLLLLAAVLVYSHWHGWQQAQLATADEEQLDFQWRQFRRRMQASVMLAVVGLVLPLHPLIRTPVLMTVFLFGLLLLVLWIVALAVADYVACRRRLTQIEDDERIERAKLEFRSRRPHQDGPDEQE